MTKLPEWAQSLADQGAEVFTLDALQHTEKGEGPWRLYCYRRDGFHVGGVWFRRGALQYPDEEITYQEAKQRAEQAMRENREVRVCDRGDMLVFHCLRGNVLHGDGFWSEP